MFCSINSRTLLFVYSARFGDARGLKLGVAQTDVRIEAAAGSGHGIRGNGLVCIQAVLFPVRVNTIFDRIVQLLGSRPEVAAAGTGSIVAVAGSGRTRMKIFVGGEPLREQLRTAHGAILIDNQTAIGFVAKERLRRFQRR